MNVTLFDVSGARIGPARISDFRAFPTYVRVPELDGRVFRRIGPNVGDRMDQYDEIRPEDATLLPKETDDAQSP